MSEWISVLDKLPTEQGYYLVYAPSYCGGSSSSKEKINNVMFSKWNGKSWSIESGYYKRPGCVMFWQPLTPPSGHDEKYTIVDKGDLRFPLRIRFETEQDFLDSTCKWKQSTENVVGDMGIELKSLEGHNVLAMYARQFSRMAYIDIFVFDNITFPRYYELCVSDSRRYYYSPIIKQEEVCQRLF